MKISVFTRVAKIEEKFLEINHRKNESGDHVFDRVSNGWWVRFEGSSESIRLFDDQPPWKLGWPVKITFEVSHDYAIKQYGVPEVMKED